MFIFQVLHALVKNWLTRVRDEDTAYYIGGSEMLPIKLNADEEACLLEQLGTQNNTQAKATLIERNLRLVAYIARKFENTGVDIEDLISIGTIGLIKAIDTFRTDKKIKLITYSSRCIENEILMYLRRNTHSKMEISIDKVVDMELEGNDLSLLDVLGTESDIVSHDIDNEADKELLSEMLDKLTEREKVIVELRFGLCSGGKEKTQKEVADLLEISQSYLSRLERKIIKKMKKEMNKMILR